MTAAIVILSVIVLLLGVLVAGVLRSHAEILRALHDLGLREDGTIDDRARHAPLTRPGVSPPRTSDSGAIDISGTKPDGAPRVVSVVGAPHTTLLAFMSTGCSTCQGFWAEFDRRRDLDLPGVDTRMVIVTKSSDSESPARLSKLAPDHWPLVMSTEAWDGYGVPVSPYFILVDGPTGQVVGEGSGTTWAQVHSLLRQAAADSGLANGTRRQARGSDREARADDELRAAGIEPGDPSLYPAEPPEASA